MDNIKQNIAKLEKGLNNPYINDELKAMMQTKIAELTTQLHVLENPVVVVEAPTIKDLEKRLVVVKKKALKNPALKVRVKVIEKMILKAKDENKKPTSISTTRDITVTEDLNDLIMPYDRNDGDIFEITSNLGTNQKYTWKGDSEGTLVRTNPIIRNKPNTEYEVVLTSNDSVIISDGKTIYQWDFTGKKSLFEGDKLFKKLKDTLTFDVIKATSFNDAYNTIIKPKETTVEKLEKKVDLTEYDDLSFVNPSKIEVEEIASGFGNKDKMKLLYDNKVIAQFYYNMKGYNKDFFLKNKDGVGFGFMGEASKNTQLKDFKKALKEGFYFIKSYNKMANGGEVSIGEYDSTIGNVASLDSHGTYWHNQILANEETIGKIDRFLSREIDNTKEAYDEQEEARKLKTKLGAKNEHLKDNFGGSEDYEVWVKNYDEKNELPFKNGGEVEKYSEAQKWWGNDLSLNEQKEYAKKNLESYEYEELLGSTSQYSKQSRSQKFINEIWEKEGKPKSILKGLY